NHVKNLHEFEELIKVFLKPSDYILCQDEREVEEVPYEKSIFVPEFLTEHFEGSKERNAIKQYLYDALCDYTGMRPDWGIHTGVRPVKQLFDLVDREGSLEKAQDVLCHYFRMSKEKVALLTHVYHTQRAVMTESPLNAVGIYIGIPFCPTRCVYCSFTSNKGTDKQIERYMDALFKEISYVGKKLKEKGFYPESIYMGGGTPTTLSAVQLDRLLIHVAAQFNLENLKEFTVEAGRPDTITREKLEILKGHDVNRISINPQSMKLETLDRIGRSHGPEEIIEGFKMAREVGIPIINADIIAGLPGETTADFIDTVKKVIALEPENITVHTMALKRASRLKEIDHEFNYKQGQTVREMLDEGKKALFEAAFHPYYLYRQKQMTGNFENVGYAKVATEGIYNIRIMEEHQTMIALGAGGITKVYYPDENRLERVPNVSNYEIYIERLDEMLERKEKNLFK
ncbi:MAG: coproporphyrinogen dehydrogenase HemZ, partial [Anaerovorax sp.]